MKKISKPESQIQEVLYYLITRIYIDRRQMMLSVGVWNLPDVIMKLRRNYGLTIKLLEIEVKNKFGRKVTYGKYKLENKKKASEVYKKLQDKQKKLNV